MADESAGVTDECMDTAESVVSVVVVETISEGSVPQTTQGHTSLGINVSALEHDDAHDWQPSSRAVPSLDTGTVAEARRLVMPVGRSLRATIRRPTGLSVSGR
jgi:hypothetical protein